MIRARLDIFKKVTDQPIQIKKPDHTNTVSILASSLKAINKIFRSSLKYACLQTYYRRIIGPAARSPIKGDNIVGDQEQMVEAMEAALNNIMTNDSEEEETKESVFENSDSKIYMQRSWTLREVLESSRRLKWHLLRAIERNRTKKARGMK